MTIQQDSWEISFIIWGHLRSDALSRQIDAVLDQCVHPSIVLVDCAPDNDLSALLQMYSCESITYVSSSNANLVVDIKGSLKNSEAYYICILGCDVVLRPDWVVDALHQLLRKGFTAVVPARCPEKDEFSPSLVDWVGKTPVCDDVVLAPKDLIFRYVDDLAGLAWGALLCAKMYAYSEKVAICGTIYSDKDYVLGGGRTGAEHLVAMTYMLSVLITSRAANSKIDIGSRNVFLTWLINHPSIDELARITLCALASSVIIPQKLNSSLAEFHESLLSPSSEAVSIGARLLAVAGYSFGNVPNWDVDRSDVSSAELSREMVEVLHEARMQIRELEAIINSLNAGRSGENG